VLETAWVALLRWQGLKLLMDACQPHIACSSLMNMLTLALQVVKDYDEDGE